VTLLDYLWHSTVAWLGIGGAIIAACLAAAYFLPPFRNLALSAAGTVAAVLAIYAKGASDAKRTEEEKRRDAEKNAIATGQADRAAAERDAAGGVRDGYDRDQQ
jgi:hypothetical protein